MGDTVVERPAKDLHSKFPGIQGFSSRNLKHMKQSNQFARLGVKTSGVRTLAPVSVRTRKSEIFGCRLSLMLPGTDVIDLKAQRKGGLREKAIFAAALRARERSGLIPDSLRCEVYFGVEQKAGLGLQGTEQKSDIQTMIQLLALGFG